MMEFKELINEEVDRLFLVVWPPWGEEKEADVDISFGFVFKSKPSQLCVLSVDKDELWSPRISIESIPENSYFWDNFYTRLNAWMKAEDDNLIIEKEYYDVTNATLFFSIVNNIIEKIELIHLNGNSEPFGIKLIFKEDYIISTPNSNGNTVETKFFNQHNNIDFFKQLGNIKYSEI